MILILDNGITKDDDLSYTKHVIKAMKNCKIDYKVVNKIQNIDDEKKIKGIIITGSSMKLSKLSKKGGFDKYSFNIYYITRYNVPVYGICFGCQLLNLIYGGELKDNKNYICKDIDFYEYEPICPLFKNISTTNLHYCFSDIVIPNKKIDVKVFASIIVNNKKLGCGFEYEKGKVYGSLFHPEYHKDTQVIFKNFYDICKKW
jgi:GMP synthase-like glutamine amidotransferase